MTLWYWCIDAWTACQQSSPIWVCRPLHKVPFGPFLGLDPKRLKMRHNYITHIHTYWGFARRYIYLLMLKRGQEDSFQTSESNIQIAAYNFLNSNQNVQLHVQAFQHSHFRIAACLKYLLNLPTWIGTWQGHSWSGSNLPPLESDRICCEVCAKRINQAVCHNAQLCLAKSAKSSNMQQSWNVLKVQLHSLAWNLEFWKLSVGCWFHRFRWPRFNLSQVYIATGESSVCICMYVCLSVCM